VVAAPLRAEHGPTPCRAAHEIQHPHGKYVGRAHTRVRAQSPARHQPDESTGGCDDIEVRCLNPNCETLNRVRRYRIQEVPTCKKCGWRLPEPITTQMVRFVRANPLLWSAFGASLVIAGFVFLDRYSPSQGLIWNAVNGSTAGFPTRYVVAAGALLFFMGFALAAKK
jgi:hypothetical protein